MAVSKGQVPINLAKLAPGKMAHARWLTTANRIMRLYVSTIDPSESLQLIANYVAMVYAPGWFQVKLHSRVVDGPKNLHKILKLCCTLSDDATEIIRPVVQRNAFFAHSENVLLAMINDERPYIRELGWRRIVKAREENKSLNTVRDFKIPDLIFRAEDYYSMIDWKEKIHEPPLTKGLSDEFLRTCIAEKASFTVGDFPCHTQSVERLIKLVTEACGKVIGRENRDGYIMAKLASYKRMPKFESKKDYMP